MYGRSLQRQNFVPEQKLFLSVFRHGKVFKMEGFVTSEQVCVLLTCDGLACYWKIINTAIVAGTPLCVRLRHTITDYFSPTTHNLHTLSEEKHPLVRVLCSSPWYVIVLGFPYAVPGCTGL